MKNFLDENASLTNYFYFKNSLLPLTPSPLFLSFFVNIFGANIIYYDLIAQTIKKNYQSENEEGSIIEIIKKTFHSRETYFFQKFIKKIDLLKFYFKDSISILSYYLH